MKQFTLGLIVGVAILAIAKAQELGITPKPQTLEAPITYIEGMIERRNRRREQGSHPMCTGDLNAMSYWQRQRVATFGAPKWCQQR